MSFPPLRPPSSKNSAANASESADAQSSSTSASARPRPSAWALPAQSSSARRGLPPLATGNPSLADIAARPPSSSSGGPAPAPAPATAPLGATFSAVLNSNPRGSSGGAGGPTAAAAAARPGSNAAAAASSSAGGQQGLTAAQLVSSPRTQGSASFGAAGLASSSAASGSAAASTTSGAGGSSAAGAAGGGGPARSATFSPSASTTGLTSPTSSASERQNPFGERGGAPTSATSNQSSVGKIIVTQVFLLLGSITEKEGKAKWDSQAENIRKLVYSNGMEVFAKYFKRLLVGNSPQIFPGINRNVENPGNYQLLVEEVEKAARDPQQAEKIAEIIDTGEGDIFRDFDLAAFLNHFKLDPIAQTILASAFTRVGKADLRSKSATILSSNFHPLLQAFAGVDNTESNPTPSVLASAAYLILRDLSNDIRDGTEKETVKYAFENRYAKANQPIPLAIRSAIVLVTMMERDAELARDVDSHGPSLTASIESAREFLRRYNRNQLDAGQIATCLLFMVLTPNGEQYQASVFVQALRDHGITGGRWHDVLRAFDREGLVVDSTQFLDLYKALEPIAHDDSTFDIQQLWGGQWNYKATQLSFAVAFASLSPSQLNAEDIPNLRLAYDPREWDDIPEEWSHFVKEAVQDPMISIDAVTAIIEGLWDPKEATAQDIVQAKQVVAEKITFFLSSAGAIPKPWVESHQALMTRIFASCLNRQQNDYQWILHCLWKEDKQYVAQRLIELHAQDPLLLEQMLDQANEHGWLNDLLTMPNGFGIDLAALAHRKGLKDLREWVEPKLQGNPIDFASGLARFLVIKAQDEMRVVHKEQPSPRTERLAMKTVYTMLDIIEEQMKEQKQELLPLKRQCMQAFPRLCNYGEGFDEIIEGNGAESNKLPPAADAEMQDLYKKMYNSEIEVRHVIEVLRDCKTSDNPERQDVFACMIHGLFDEYSCFNEYPLAPLATTAVLFGGIINYGILSRFTLDVGLEMILEAVRDYPPDSSMYKFGLQALMHFKGRLREWKDMAQSLVQVPGLQGTPIYGPAQDALREGGPSPSNDSSARDRAANGKRDMNGNVDEFLSSDSLVPQFRSVNPDIPTNVEFYEEPEENIQDKILFVLNNVTEQNLTAKIGDIADSLLPKHYQWFASYLVEQRAKSQPNYQGLYLELLGMLGDKNLWSDVLRETYVSVRRVLNSEATMKNAVDRTHLKNLGTWLGSLTISRDRPIKHKNIAFKELLIEGWETQRLLLVIPFTCEVLAQGNKSVVFRPPNPWVMEIVGLLLELYDLPDLKIQQKFAVEVLLGTFGLPRNGDGLERSTELKKRQQRYEAEMGESMMADGVEAFDDMAIGNLNRGLRNTRLSPTDIASTLPDLSTLLVFPPASSSPINHNRLRQIVQAAVQRSIMEIIGPVVERSVTIATIATKDLVTKDYAQEPDEDHVREAFETMAKTTSGSLAAVTCKEPLRMSITNFIRNAGAETPNDAIPEGLILMAVNDNIEIACKIVQQQAEERALPEIKPVIEAEIQKRQQHKANFPNEPYRDPNTSQWSSYIPEPYKQVPGGLNQQQLDIYGHFAPQARSMTAHNQTASTDSGKQIPDVLQEPGFTNVPNLTTPAEQPALPHQQPQMPPSNVPLALANSRAPSQVNGYMDGANVQDHIENALSELGRVTHGNTDPDQKLKDLPRDSPVIAVLSRVLNLIRSSQDPDGQAFWVAGALHRTLYNESESNSKFDTAVLVQALKQICLISPPTFAKLHLVLQKSTDEQILNIPVTAALLEVELLEYAQVDGVIARLLVDRQPKVLESFEKLLDIVLFSSEPIALRGDFVHSFGVMGEWVAQTPDLEVATRIVSKLKSTGIPESADPPADQEGHVKQEQLHYIFQEWLAVYGHPNRSESLSAAFIAQLQKQGVLDSQVDLAQLLKLGIESACESFERTAVMNPQGDLNEAHYEADALARFVVMLVKTRGSSEDDSGKEKSAYFKSLLFLIVLILNNHQVIRGEHFNQRTFFRIFSSILYDWHEMIRGSDPTDDKRTILNVADTILLLDPNAFSAFTFGWLQLVAHRVFMPAVLKDADTEGLEVFARIVEAMLSYVSKMLKPTARTPIGKELYDGALRIILILHHDFPEFVAENHYRLCDVIPSRCTQLRNLVLSAFPSSIYELPDPFGSGLKVDRLEDMRKAPVLAGDPFKPLVDASLMETVDNLLKGSVTAESVVPLNEALATAQQNAPAGHGSALGQSLMLYLGHTALSSGGASSAGSGFKSDSPQAEILTQLMQAAPVDIRYHLLGALANQLRYPNSHTQYFSNAMLHLFGAAAATSGADSHTDDPADLRPQIVRVLLERLIVHRPHPWGLIITLLELLKNSTYAFWDLPFIKAAPEIGTIIQRLVDLGRSASLEEQQRAMQRG